MKKINSMFCTTAVALMLTSTGCVDLDQEPLSSLPAEAYFNSESQLQSYVNNLYAPRTGDDSNDQTFDVHGTYSYGTFAIDNNTDNMASKGRGDDRWVPANYKVGQDGGDWSFSYIYKVNYFFKYVVHKYEAGEIAGSEANIKQYIGEAYFFRAFEYFKRLQKVGDYPIITEPLPDEMDVLIEASKRSPRNEVARFILADLDKAIALLNDKVATTRVTKKAALLFKSRVALFEGTWEKYFKGTAFVPGGEGWPGATKDYNQGKTFNIDSEIAYFLGEAMAAAKEVADNTPLTTNSGILPQAVGQTNPYLEMFGEVDMSKHPEIILWRQYNYGLDVYHGVPQYTHTGCHLIGLTRGYVDNFLMADGSPIYATGSGYQGDDSIAGVVKNRDLRLQIFLKVPGQLNYFQPGTPPERATPVEAMPNITEGNSEIGYSTGYTIRKGINFSQEHYTGNNVAFTGCIVFRAAEAYLNYIEAKYEKDGTLDATAQTYWEKIRSRANNATVTFADIQSKTIDKTITGMEVNNDWAAFSGGKLLTDKTLYSIRRERRSELLAEGLRMPDLRRWRALDQLVNNPYHIEGFKLWGPMKNLYSGLEPGINVSSSEQSLYLLPYEASPTSDVFKQGGYLWKMAHYLSPIAAEHFLVSSVDGSSPETSPIYQNPYWSTRANEAAIK
ncbi:starch-binding protein [Bacteroidia bacterium]|nr:starch-binding protein [Bacteroidia bacterium]